jgi:hypothetical protein
MSQNLNLLRQNYCRPATFTGKRTRYLFPLERERECEQGKTLLAKAPKTLLHLQEFDPYGLQQTYRDEATGAELPVFAVFDLEGNHQFAVEITTDSVPTTAQPNISAADDRYVLVYPDRRGNSTAAFAGLDSPSYWSRFYQISKNYCYIYFSTIWATGRPELTPS